MPITEADAQASLRTLLDPNTGRDFVSTKSIRKIAVDGNNVAVDVLLAYPAKSQHEILRKLVHNHIAALPGVGKVKARKIMEDIGIADNRRVQGLGAVQKQSLLDQLGK